MVIELTGGICPLTPLENWLRERAGETGYADGFIEHYVLPVLYPARLTRTIQLALAVLMLMVNGYVYGRMRGRSADVCSDRRRQRRGLSLRRAASPCPTARPVRDPHAGTDQHALSGARDRSNQSHVIASGIMFVLMT